MTLEEYRKKIANKSYYRFGQEDLDMGTLNPACMVQRWCLTGDPKYWTLPSSSMMIKIQDEVTKGKVTIEDMVREHARKKKEHEK
jgi:hypothetical protein